MKSQYDNSAYTYDHDIIGEYSGQPNTSTSLRDNRSGNAVRSFLHECGDDGEDTWYVN